jgi:hypothetical protein
MSNPFAILADQEAPAAAAPADAVPHKGKRDKDRHDSGTGRRDKTKRDDRGGLAWGNAIDIHNRPELAEHADASPPQAGSAAESPAPTPKPEYVSAVGIFGDSSDDEDGNPGIPQAPSKPVAVVPAAFQKLIGNRPTNDAKTVVTTSEPETPLFEVGFLSTQEALKQQAERPRGPYGSSPPYGRGSPRGGRGGGPRRGDFRPEGERRGGRSGPRREREEPIRQRPEPIPDEAADEKRRGRKPPREARPVAPQHQRDGGRVGKNPHLSLKDFPSLN